MTEVRKLWECDKDVYTQEAPESNSSLDFHHVRAIMIRWCLGLRNKLGKGSYKFLAETIDDLRNADGIDAALSSVTATLDLSDNAKDGKEATKLPEMAKHFFVFYFTSFAYNAKPFQFIVARFSVNRLSPDYFPSWSSTRWCCCRRRRLHRRLCRHIVSTVKRANFTRRSIDRFLTLSTRSFNRSGANVLFW